MATLEALIDRLASLKVNQVQLYSEHTFAYRNHPEVHAAASPIDAAEIRQLDAFCRARHVELVPNQNCLGHMNRWLRARSLPAAGDRAGRLRRSVRHHPAADDDRAGEPGLARARPRAPGASCCRSSRAAGSTSGSTRRGSCRRAAWTTSCPGWPRCARCPSSTGGEMLMWGDMVSGRPDLVASLPAGRDGVRMGLRRLVSRSTSAAPSWPGRGCRSGWRPGPRAGSSILGRITNARTTCRRAAAAALAHGGSGYLNTDWGDIGHLQQSVISEPGLAYGAAVSWCLAANGDLDLGAALSTHVFGDPTGALADAVLALGDAHLLVTPQFPNMSALVMNLYYPQLPVGRGLTAGLTAEELDAVDGCLDGARAAAGGPGPTAATPRCLIDEVLFSTDLVALLTDDARARLRGDGSLGSWPRTSEPACGARLDALVERYRVLWNGRNRPGGLERQPQLAAQPAGRLRIGSPGSAVGRPPGTDRRIGSSGARTADGRAHAALSPSPSSASSSSSSASWQSHEQ